MYQGRLAGRPAASVKGCPSRKPGKPKRGEDAALRPPLLPPRHGPRQVGAAALSTSVQMRRLASGHDGAGLRRHALGPGRDQPPAQRHQLGAALRPAGLSITITITFTAPQRGHLVRGGDVPVWPKAGAIQPQRIADAHPASYFPIRARWRLLRGRRSGRTWGECGTGLVGREWAEKRWWEPIFALCIFQYIYRASVSSCQTATFALRHPLLASRICSIVFGRVKIQNVLSQLLA